MLLLDGPAFASGPGPQYSGVDPDRSELVQRLLEKSKENKATYDQQRLDNFYKRDYNINKIAGHEVLPEPCDPRDPEFGYKCRNPLPRLPQERLDPFDPRNEKYAPRRGAVFGSNDLDIDLDADFAAIPAGPPPGDVAEEPAVDALGDVDQEASEVGRAAGEREEDGGPSGGAEASSSDGILDQVLGDTVMGGRD